MVPDVALVEVWACCALGLKTTWTYFEWIDLWIMTVYISLQHNSALCCFPVFVGHSVSLCCLPALYRDHGLSASSWLMIFHQFKSVLTLFHQLVSPKGIFLQVLILYRLLIWVISFLYWLVQPMT